MSEFLATVSRKKAHRYRVFDPGDIEPSYEKFQSTFPSLATLTMMEDCHMKQLFLHLGLAKTRNDCVYADRQAWDNFIAREELKSSKREFKNRNLELSKEHTVKRKKIEREKERLASSKELEAKPFKRLTTSCRKK